MVAEYTVERTLGGGGMATVYLARSGDGRPVALKVMQPQLANDPSFVQRFLHEVRSTIGLHHPNIVEVYAYGEEGGRYWMASEYVDGGTVEDLLKTIPRMPAPLAVEIFAQLVSGLHYAHQQGIVHRDVKPANMLLTRAGVLKVADFGIAKTVGGAALTQTGMLVGTPAYMSPEQARGAELDARSDLYAAGIVLYELLSGENPNAAADAAATVGRLLQGVVPPIYEKEPTVPPEIEVLLDRLLDKEPAARPASGAEVLDTIAGYLGAARRRHPDLLAAALADPATTLPRLIRAEAEHWLSQGKRLLQAGPAERRQAALALYRAVLRDPTLEEASHLLEQVSSAEGLTFGESQNPKIRELEALLAEDPENAGILQRLANLYRNEGNLYRAVGYFKRYLRLRPDDGYTAGQLSLLTGYEVEVRPQGSAPGRSRSPRGAPPVPAGPATAGAMGSETAALVAGVQTGGFRAAGPVAPGHAPQVATGEDDGPEAEASALDYARAFLSAYGWKLGVLILVVGGGWLIFSRIGGAIEEARDETFQTAEQLARAKDQAQREALDRQHAQKLAEAGAKAAADAKAALERGIGLVRTGKHDEAISVLEALRTDHPKREQADEALFWIGKAQLASGHPYEAADTFQAFLEARPGSDRWVEGLMERAQALYESGQLEQAIDVCTTLLEEHPSSGLVRRARMLRARAHEDQGDKEAAAADYREVIGSTGAGAPYYDEARAGLARVAPGE